MNPPPFELSLLLCACAAALPFTILCATASAQGQPDVGVESLVAKIDAARGKAASPMSSLAVEGTLAIEFAGVPAAGYVMNGKFREVFAGADRARHVSDLGEQGGVLESGITADTAWEVDPVMGARVYAGAQAQTVRRHFALLRGASPRELYESIARVGTQELDGREHVLLRMTPAQGKADTWYVDPETGVVGRIDITLPASEGAQAVWGMDAEIETQVVLGDWRKVGGALHPYRRAVTMGPATFTFTSTKVEAGVRLEPREFTPPAAVLDLKNATATAEPIAGAAAAGADATAAASPYAIVARPAQSVASIRVKCSPQEISATLAVVLPEIMAHLNASGAKMTGVPFSRYHAFGAAEIDLEAGLPVAKPIAEKGRVKNSELPAGRTVTAWHIGPYEQLGDAHRSLQAYLEANRLKSRGGPWEVYWTDPGMVTDPSKWRTQLFMPIED